MLEARSDKTEFDSKSKSFDYHWQGISSIEAKIYNVSNGHSLMLNCQANEQKIYSSQSLERNLVGLRK